VRTTVPIHEEIMDAVGKAIPSTFTLPKPNMRQRGIKINRDKNKKTPAPAGYRTHS